MEPRRSSIVRFVAQANLTKQSREAECAVAFDPNRRVGAFLSVPILDRQAFGVEQSACLRLAVVRLTGSLKQPKMLVAQDIRALNRAVELPHRFGKVRRHTAFLRRHCVCTNRGIACAREAGRSPERCGLKNLDGIYPCPWWGAGGW